MIAKLNIFTSSTKDTSGSWDRMQPGDSRDTWQCGRQRWWRLGIRYVHHQRTYTKLNDDSISGGIQSFLLCSKPAFKRHDSMMIDVKEGEMSELFLGHEEEWVEHVKELGHVEQPGKVQSSEWSKVKVFFKFWKSPQCLRVLRVVNRLTSPAVVSANVESRKYFWKQKYFMLTIGVTSSPPWSPRDWREFERDCKRW